MIKNQVGHSLNPVTLETEIYIDITPGRFPKKSKPLVLASLGLAIIAACSAAGVLALNQQSAHSPSFQTPTATREVPTLSSSTCVTIFDGNITDGINRLRNIVGIQNNQLELYGKTKYDPTRNILCYERK